MPKPPEPKSPEWEADKCSAMLNPLAGTPSSVAIPPETPILVPARVSGLDGSDWFYILGRRVFIGSGVSGPDNLRLQGDRAIAPQHAYIRRWPDGLVEIRDLDSKSGTFVNDRRVRSAALADGDTVRFGFRSFTFRAMLSDSSRLPDLAARAEADRLTIERCRKQGTEPFFGAMRAEDVPHFQRLFDRTIAAINIENWTRRSQGESIPGDWFARDVEIRFEIGLQALEVGLEPVFLHVAVEQFIFADPLSRALSREGWIENVRARLTEPILPFPPAERTLVMLRALGLPEVFRGQLQDPPTPPPEPIREAVARSVAASDPTRTVFPSLVLHSVLQRDVVLLNDAELLIGRAPSCKLRLHGESEIAPQHAQINRLPDGGMEIHSLESESGTFVNGHRISSALLTDGDTVDIGSKRFTFRAAGWLTDGESTRALPIAVSALDRLRGLWRRLPPNGIPNMVAAIVILGFLALRAWSLSTRVHGEQTAVRPAVEVAKTEDAAPSLTTATYSWHGDYRALLKYIERQPGKTVSLSEIDPDSDETRSFVLRISADGSLVDTSDLARVPRLVRKLVAKDEDAVSRMIIRDHDRDGAPDDLSVPGMDGPFGTSRRKSFDGFEVVSNATNYDEVREVWDFDVGFATNSLLHGPRSATGRPTPVSSAVPAAEGAPVSAPDDDMRQ